MWQEPHKHSHWKPVPLQMLNSYSTLHLYSKLALKVLAFQQQVILNGKRTELGQQCG